MAILTIQIEIPDPLLEAGAVELFATNVGWNPTLTDENGNPIPPFDFAVAHLKHYMYGRAKKQFRNGVVRDADAMFASLANESHQNP